MCKREYRVCARLKQNPKMSEWNERTNPELKKTNERKKKTRRYCNTKKVHSYAYFHSGYRNLWRNIFKCASLRGIIGKWKKWVFNSKYFNMTAWLIRWFLAQIDSKMLISLRYFCSSSIYQKIDSRDYFERSYRSWIVRFNEIHMSIALYVIIELTMQNFEGIKKKKCTAFMCIRVLKIHFFVLEWYQLPLNP